MNPQVSIIMGSLSDMPVMEEAARFLDQMEIPRDPPFLLTARPVVLQLMQKGRLKEV